MMKFRGLALAVLLTGLSCFAQAQPCPTGTLANVMGTSCTIGHITFNFGSNFQGLSQANGTTVFFGPDAIEFVPINSGNQTGFQLALNFVANPNATSLDSSSSNASFSYGLQIDSTSEIVSETASIVGNVTQVSFDAISAFDAHLFTNRSFTEVAPSESYSQSGFFNEPQVTSTLTSPGVSTGTINVGGLPFTTEVNAVASIGDDATLSSASFIYTTAPRIPTPLAGNFRFQNIDLPIAPQTTAANGINDRGQIVGSFQDAQGSLHGYIMEGTDFQTFDFPSASLTIPAAISNSGTVVGVYSDAFGNAHGFILENGTFTSIDFPGAIFTEILDLNESGDMVGIYQLPDFGVHGFIRDKNGITSIDDPQQTSFFPFTEAFGINNRKNVIGAFADSNANLHGFSLFHGIFQQIDVPGSESNIPAGSNNAEDIVGIYTDLDNVQHGYVQRGNNFSTLDVPGAVGTTVLSQINNSGTIVGSYVDDQGLIHSFIADQQPGGGPAPDSGRTKITPTQTCSLADWAKHPEKITNPKACHFGK
jgi:hypothetical protein